LEENVEALVDELADNEFEIHRAGDKLGQEDPYLV
jgi:hypothetical protein